MPGSNTPECGPAMNMTNKNETKATLTKDTAYVTPAMNTFERVGLNLSLNPKPVSAHNSRTAIIERVRAIAIISGAYSRAT
jgi:hypothetical protein